MLTEAQVIALEKAKTEKKAHGEFESEHRAAPKIRIKPDFVEAQKNSG